MAITFDSGFISYCFQNSLSKYDSRIFDGMMTVHFQIPFRMYRQIEQSVSCKSIQHMIKKTDSCINLRLSGSIQVQSYRNIRLLCRSCPGDCSVHSSSPPYFSAVFYSSPSKRTLIELACAVSCSASANASISLCISRNASSEYPMILDFLMKSSTESGEKNFAVPLVGRTWFGPAK